jgi:hypothetical protein
MNEGRAGRRRPHCSLGDALMSLLLGSPFATGSSPYRYLAVASRKAMLGLNGAPAALELLASATGAAASWKRCLRSGRNLRS